MNLRLVHRRLAIMMGFSGLVAFAGGAGFEPISATPAALALATALFWQPDPELSERMEKVWLPLAGILVARALVHIFVIGDDVVIPVVDLLLLLMAAEALRSLDAPNDVRMYALAFALLLASTAYRPGLLFLLAFVAFVVLATLGLMVGHLRRKAEEHGVREVPLGRSLVTTTAGLSLVTLAVAAGVFVTFPRVSRGWSGRGDATVTSIAGFADQVSIGEFGSRIYPNPRIVLRVEFPRGAPADLQALHWRGRSYDHFDGIRWSRSRNLPPAMAPTAWYRERWRGGVVTQKIYGAPLDVRVLFALHPVLNIDPDSRIQPLFDNAGDFVYWGSGAPSYTVRSRALPPAPEQLRQAGRGFTPARQQYLQLPTLDPRIRRLADSLTAGLDTRYDKVAAIEGYLHTFRYTLDLPATATEATLEHFLFERRAGHCEYFSTAMVVLLRAVGIHSRNVNGFLGGEWTDFGRYLAVTQNQAHSWVEVWFPGYGWVEFDPTPAGGGVGSRTEAWFWPGKIFFDGLQHRWNKWILDFNMESQVGIFQRWAELRTGHRLQEAITRTAADAGPGLLGALALALALATGFWWVHRGIRSLPRSTRTYLQLRRAAERAGLHVNPGLTPLALVERIRTGSGAPAEPAERVVDLYLRVRYGGHVPTESELQEMRRAASEARRLLSHGGRRAATP